MKYDPALDGLRSVAVTSVVAHHISEALVPGGWVGVDIFFVLSGFLITRLLTNELMQARTIDLPRFYVRRLIRLGPALWSMLILLIPFAFALGNINRLMKAAVISCLYLTNWARAFQIGDYWILGHTWSLAIEEQFYLLWPAIILLCRRRLVPVTLCLVLAIFTWRATLVWLGASSTRVYNGLDTHGDALMLGALLSLIEIPTYWRSAVARLSPLWLLLMLVAGATLHINASVTGTFYISLISLLSMLLIIAAREDGWFRRFLSQRLLVYTGRLSYGWYLWHYPLLMIAREEGSPNWALPLVALGSYGFAALSLHLVEQPIGNWLKAVLPVAHKPSDRSASATLESKRPT